MAWKRFPYYCILPGGIGRFFTCKNCWNNTIFTDYLRWYWRLCDITVMSHYHDNISSQMRISPAGTRRNDNVFTTSTRRRRRRVDVVKTLSLHHYCVMCPLGGVSYRNTEQQVVWGNAYCLAHHGEDNMTPGPFCDGHCWSRTTMSGNGD